jgi:hypothetical protein
VLAIRPSLLPQTFLGNLNTLWASEGIWAKPIGVALPNGTILDPSVGQDIVLLGRGAKQLLSKPLFGYMLLSS